MKRKNLARRIQKLASIVDSRQVCAIVKALHTAVPLPPCTSAEEATGREIYEFIEAARASQVGNPDPSCLADLHSEYADEPGGSDPAT